MAEHGGPSKKVAFFDYFNAAKARGLPDHEAYHFAITEDIYDAEGVRLQPGEATSDGVCYHVRPNPPGKLLPSEILSLLEKLPFNPYCMCCGAELFLKNTHIPKDDYDRTQNFIWWAEPRKLSTRSESEAMLVNALLASQPDGDDNAK